MSSAVEGRFLTTGPPGKSPRPSLLIGVTAFYSHTYTKSPSGPSLAFCRVCEQGVREDLQQILIQKLELQFSELKCTS